MALSFQKVQPGDLISSEKMNQIFIELERLEARVGQLEASATGNDSSVVILGHLPDGSLTVGTRMTLIGRNFAQPATHNIVNINTTRVPDANFRSGNSDSRLVFDIPIVLGLSSGSNLATLTVNNQNGSATHPFTLRLQQIVPVGRVEVLYIAAPIPPVSDPNILRSQSYVFGFQVTAFVTIEATYQVQAIFSASGWTAELLEQASDTPRPNNQLTIPGDTNGVTQNFRIRVNVPNLSSGSATLSLAITETSGNSQVNPGNQTITMAIGAPPPSPENRVLLSLRSVTQAQIVGSLIQFRRNQAGAITFNVRVTQEGRYNFQAQIRDSTGWSQLPVLDITQADIAANQNQDVSVILTPGSSASNTELELSITSSNISPPMAVNYIQAISVI